MYIFILFFMNEEWMYTLHTDTTGYKSIKNEKKIIKKLNIRDVI